MVMFTKCTVGVVHLLKKYIKYKIEEILFAFAKSRKEPIVFMSVRLSACIISGSHWPNMRGILCFGLVLKSVSKVQVFIKSDCKLGYFALRRVFKHTGLCISTPLSRI
jgi:hypothetical protein